MEHLIELRDVYKIYQMGDEAVHALDGISLTVATVGETSISISAIPHTVRQTVLHHRRKGDLVNLETDIIGKYIEKLLQPAAPQPKESTITMDLLSRCGF